MILDSKGGLLEGADDVDAPPAYDELERNRNSSGFRGDRKDGSGPAPTHQAGPSTLHHTATPTTQSSARSGQHGPQGQPVTAGQGPVGTSKIWFGLGSWYSEKDTRKQVKQTIQSLLRDVLKQPTSPASVSVLESCLEACQARGLSFQSIVSEKFIEGHCPLYWAIVKRPAARTSDPPDDRVQLLDILLSFPLDSTTRSEAYLACLLSSDQVLFQRLRHTPGDHSPSVSAAHELLLGEAPTDDVRSFDREGDHGEFKIVWKIAQFQRRMRAIGGVGTEVVARGRIWSLAFVILPRDTTCSGNYIKAGTWVASISLLAPSPPTYLEAQFSISEPTSEPSSPETPSPSPELSSHPLVNDPNHLTASARPPGQTLRKPFGRWSNPSKQAQKPPITLRLKSVTLQLEALSLPSTKQDLRNHVLSQPGHKTLIVPLNLHANGDSLQYDGCTYIYPDGSLYVTLDGRLAKSGPGADCIIC